MIYILPDKGWVGAGWTGCYRVFDERGTMHDVHRGTRICIGRGRGGQCLGRGGEQGGGEGIGTRGRVTGNAGGVLDAVLTRLHLSGKHG